MAISKSKIRQMIPLHLAKKMRKIKSKRRPKKKRSQKKKK